MSDNSSARYDAILFVSFGGPEGRDDVIPFLENVLRGRNVPRERMLEVAEHYFHFDGVSPINQQVRDLMGAVREELPRHNIDLPVYWGNRNWHPLLPETLARMRDDGVRRVLAFFMSAYSSYSGCRQYRENIHEAREQVGDGAPKVDKTRMFYNHPDFIAASADCLSAALEQVPAEGRNAARVVYTAHSIPDSMARRCDYVRQLQETARLTSEACGVDASRWDLVYQSRSGRPQDPWLEPDIVDHLQTLSQQGVEDAIVAPIGFLSDHMEVLYDLDDEAATASQQAGLNMVRAATVGTHPRFVTMICKLFAERLYDDVPREAIGQFGPNWDVCPMDCCLPPARPAAQPASRE
ncbi:MAG: ferrochelatase [Maioricimonas sp. JB049]